MNTADRLDAIPGWRRRGRAHWERRLIAARLRILRAPIGPALIRAVADREVAEMAVSRLTPNETERIT